MHCCWFAKLNQFDNIILQYDTTALYPFLGSSSQKVHWEIASIIEDIKETVINMPGVNFCYISKSANSVSDWIAKFCLSHGCFANWSHSPPLTLTVLCNQDSIT